MQAVLGLVEHHRLRAVHHLVGDLLAAVRGDGFDAPCTVTVDYAVTDQVTHAFCDGIDCVPLQRRSSCSASAVESAWR